MKTYSEIGIQFPEILLPKDGVDMHKWATIACDQFTSEPEYWEQVSRIVGDAPSTFNLVLPEVYLGTSKEKEQLDKTQKTMEDYLQKGIFRKFDHPIYVERTSLGKTRKGIILALDLDKYDFNRGSQSLIRATEGTILDRLPPRIRIREGASLELPHILVLVDDPQNTLFAPIEKKKQELSSVYDFDLMLGSGHLAAWEVIDSSVENGIVDAIRGLAKPETFYPKYGVDSSHDVLLFAVGDGNHSLATAKSIWEKLKPHVEPDHPARFALVEIENVHDAGLNFEPIHRVLFGVQQDPQEALKAHFGDYLHLNSAASFEAMKKIVDEQSGPAQKIGFVSPKGYAVLKISNPPSNLPVGTLQCFLDPWVNSGEGGKIDYVHGSDVVENLGSHAGNCGFYLPPMKKTDLFKTVILDGALPRKTFSMGEAVEKRFYVEARRIKPV